MKNDKEEWLTFALVFYAVQILFRTLYNRYWFTNPVSNVFGTWGFYTEKNGEMVLTTEVPENIILFLPFIILLFIRYKEKIFGEKVLLGKVIWQSIKIAFISSFIIESLQLFLRLGTWQLSDLAFNTLGGLIGGLVYWIGYKVKHRESKR